jgi:hypothetical protein
MVPIVESLTEVIKVKASGSELSPKIAVMVIVALLSAKL